MANAVRNSSRIAFLIFLAFLLIAFGYMMRLFWIPAGLGAVTVVLCTPLHHRLLRWCRGRRYLAATGALILVAAFLLLPIGGIVATIIAEIVRFSQHLVDQLQDGQFATAIDQCNAWLTGFFSRFGEFAPTEFNLRATLMEAARVVARTLYQFSPKVLASTAHVSVMLCFWLLFVFVFFAEGPRLYHYFMELSPLAAAHEETIAREVREMVSAVLLAMVATSAINAVLMGLAFWVAPLPRPVVWGLVTFGLSFIPVVGAFSVWCGGAIYLLLLGQWGWALGLTLFGLVIIAQTDNIVKPLVMRGRVKIHPVLLLLGLLGGVQLLGPSGLIFGPVFIAILLAALRIYRREFV